MDIQNWIYNIYNGKTDIVNYKPYSNGCVADWLYDNDFDDIEDAENAGMVNYMNEKLKADYYDDFIAEQLDYINYNHTCVELDNGNYMFME